MVAVTNNLQNSAAGAMPAWECGIGGVPVGFQTITPVTLLSATKLTVPATAKLAIVTVDGIVSGQSNGVRWRDDGTDPTSAIGGGTFLPPGVWPYFTYSADLAKISFIAVGTIGALNAVFYK